MHPSVEQVTVPGVFVKMSFPWDTDGAINRIGDKREKNQAGADRQNNMKRKDKANRSRGGKRSRGDREAYEWK